MYKIRDKVIPINKLVGRIGFIEFQKKFENNTGDITISCFMQERIVCLLKGSQYYFKKTDLILK